MKKTTLLFRQIIGLVLLAFFMLSQSAAEGQIMKKIGKKVERSVQQRVDRKIDRGIDKGLDKVEKGVDDGVKEATTAKPKEEKAVEANQEIKNEAPQTPVDGAPYSIEEAEKAKSNNGLVLVSANCNDFAWFKKGAVLEFEVKVSGEKKSQNSKIEVKDVRTEGNKTIADITASDDSGHEIQMNYLCSGNQLYFDLSDMLRSALEKQGQKGADMDITFDGGLLSVPKNIYPGQQLEDAVFTMNMSSQGMNIAITSYLQERSVAGTETVATPAGSFRCIKITGVRSMEMKMLGSKRKMGEPVIEEMYFAPGIGVVKSVSKTKKGKIEYEQQLIKYSL